MKRTLCFSPCRFLLLLVAGLLSSCVYYDGYDQVPGTYGYGTYTEVPRSSYIAHSYPGSYSSPYRRPAHYYSTAGRSLSACHRCGYAPCRCSHHQRYGRTGVNHYPGYHGGHSNRSHSSHSSSHSSHSSSNLKHRPNSYQIAGGSVGRGRTQPKGYHSIDWYKKKGYDVSKLKLRNEEGESYGSKGSSKKKKKH